MLRRISTPLDIYYFRIGINNTVKFYLLLYFVEVSYRVRARKL